MPDYPGRQAVEARLAGRLAMVAPEAYKAYGLAVAVPGLRVLTGASGETAEALRQVGAEVVSVPGEAGEQTSHALVSSPAGQAALAQWAPGPVALFRPEHRLEELLAALGCRPLAAKASVARRLENKQAFRRLAGEAGLPVVPCSALRWPLEPSSVDALVARWGTRLVVQTPRGYAGRRSWIWEAGTHLDAPDWLQGQQVLVAPWLTGPTWTVNAVVLPEGVRVGAPMRQVTGDPRLTELPLASAGAAFEPPGAEAVRDELSELARRVGEMARGHGFRGFFGIDTVGEAGRLRLIEMNPRLTATLTAATLAELAAGRLPLTVSHVLSCLGEPLAQTDADGDVALSGGGHLVVRQEAEAAGRPRLGIYGTSGFRDGAGGWPPVDGVTVWPAGPRAGGPADERCRLMFSGPMLLPTGGFTPLVEGALTSTKA